MLQHTKGNLLDLAEAGQFDIIVHGCNCKNTMGSGIAKEIKERYPSAAIVDTAAHRDALSEIELLGNYSYTWENGNSYTGKFIIVNAYTQLDYWPRGKDHFQYESFQLILRKLAITFKGKRFGFPYIGMGLAGGNKDSIMTMLEVFAMSVAADGGSVTLVEFDG